MDGKFTDSVASPSDSLEGAHAHAINTRPSFLPRGAGSEARCVGACENAHMCVHLYVECMFLYPN